MRVLRLEKYVDIWRHLNPRAREYTWHLTVSIYQVPRDDDVLPSLSSSISRLEREARRCGDTNDTFDHVRVLQVIGGRGAADCTNIEIFACVR
jgi:hypothetical protein